MEFTSTNLKILDAFSYIARFIPETNSLSKHFIRQLANIYVIGNQYP